MGKRYDTLNSDLQAWIAQQMLFFVATAPLAADGHVNCSPKGADTFRILDERTVAYLDMTGSGIETVAHVQENRRIVIMFCAFEGAPKTVRLHGHAEVLYPDHPEFSHLGQNFESHLSARAIVRVTLTRISDSCGFGVPRFNFVAQRDAMDRWAEAKGCDGLIAYRREKNRASIDGIPGYKTTS